MKNSDMKVIAIILCIALFFTFIVSNAAAIASIMLVVKGPATQETVQQDGNQDVNTKSTKINQNFNTILSIL